MASVDGIDLVIPDAEERRLIDRGAAGVILGCTEIELLIGPDDAPVPVFPTTAIHVAAAVDFALQPVTSADGA